MPVTISIRRNSLLRLDSPEIIKRMDAATVRGIARASGLVRIIAQRSMRRRVRAAKPGEPPSVRQGNLKDMLVFGIENAGFASVIGSIGYGNANVPELMEYGGWSASGYVVTQADGDATGGSGPVRRVRTRPGHPRHPGWRTVFHGSNRPGDRVAVRQTAPLLPRPYMYPALETAMPRIPEEWRGQFR